ncbi:MAG: hypothetical protein Q7S95_00940 [bacterium]|nr:hypothetical protein [bacterium]
MQLKVKKISDAGIYEKERIVLEVTSNTQIGNYFVLKSKRTAPGKISSIISEVFWLPDREVKKDDLVVIYSKLGKSSTKVNESGSTSYFFYLGKNLPVWNSKDDCALLLETADWNATFVAPKKD